MFEPGSYADGSEPLPPLPFALAAASLCAVVGLAYVVAFPLIFVRWWRR